MPTKPSNVNQYLRSGCGRCALGGTPGCKVNRWKSVLTQLRLVLQKTDLVEEIKWSAPCYTFDGKNILMLSALKDSVVISFFRGAELDDSNSNLEKPGQNSRFARYWRFNSEQEIKSNEKLILSYIDNAIAISQTTPSSQPESNSDKAYPAELMQAFASDKLLAKAFAALTPGRQRGYLIFFSSAKQSKTKQARIQKSREKIMSGKGWNER